MENSEFSYTIIHDDIDGETNWYYYPSGVDHSYNIIKNDWLNSCRDKYFKYVKNKNVMITCGAHIGMYTRFYAKEFNRVYAFEPHPFHFFCLVNNVWTDKVVKIQSAVGNENKLVNFFTAGVPGLTYSVDKNNFYDAYIPMIKIDDLNLPECDLIQMDIENYEFEALKGAAETIKRCSPVIIMENGHIQEIVEFLEPLNYKIVDTTSYDTIWTKNEEV